MIINWAYKKYKAKKEAKKAAKEGADPAAEQPAPTQDATPPPPAQ